MTKIRKILGPLVGIERQLITGGGRSNRPSLLATDVHEPGLIFLPLGSAWEVIFYWIRNDTAFALPQILACLPIVCMLDHDSHLIEPHF